MLFDDPNKLNLCPKDNSGYTYVEVHTGYKSSLDPKEIKNKEKGGPISPALGRKTAGIGSYLLEISEKQPIFA